MCGRGLELLHGSASSANERIDTLHNCNTVLYCLSRLSSETAVQEMRAGVEWNGGASDRSSGPWFLTAVVLELPSSLTKLR